MYLLPVHLLELFSNDAGLITKDFALVGDVSVKHFARMFKLDLLDERNSVLTVKPASVIAKDTSSGVLTTPATDLTRDMKSSGNHTMQISSATIIPPIPYFTTAFFFWPRGWGYFCRRMQKQDIKMCYSAKQRVFL